MPYHHAIDDHLGQRQLRELPTAVIAMHSFTPVFRASRPWQVGLLFNRYPEFAHLLAELLREEGDLQVGINEPYAMTDATDYTLPVHAERRGLPYVGIEIPPGSDRRRTWATGVGERFAPAAAGLAALANLTLGIFPEMITVRNT